MLEKGPIRLVIWDLDETFWRGTLSEGGIQEYVQDHHRTVIELAKRGIISSICSKNDHASVERILKEYGIWDYFILPSIDWTSKGPRLKALIDDIQLRPETVLFIDDNAGNRAEAAAHVPGLHIADESIIPTLLTDALFTGKDDTSLTRLQQYQLLQRRKLDEKATDLDNASFLRSSHIRVTIEPNIEAHLDRAVELINRTNQLNFTKLRLPDDKIAAGQELLKMVNRYFNQAGLIRVSDKYGDYGFCGLYVILTIHDVKKLLHFCFSCRILGMGVERWLFQKIGKPEIHIKGDVQADLHAEGDIDWINQDFGGALLFAEGNEGASLPVSGEVLQYLAPQIRLQGGCELDALSHYLRQETPQLLTRTNSVEGAFLIRQDMSTNIVLALSPLDENIQNELNSLALTSGNFNGQHFASPPPGTLFVISAWGDLYVPVYRHKTLGCEIGVALRTYCVPDLTKATPADLENYAVKNALSEESKEQVNRVIQHLAAHYTCLSRANEASLRRNWLKIFERIPKDCLLVVLLPNCHRGADSSWGLKYHAIAREVARHFPNIVTLDMTAYLHRNEDLQDAVDHFDRMVYFNVYKDLLQEFGKRLAFVSTQTDNKLVALSDA